MEVAPRTIYRDMDHLIASGAPIEGERGVGYMLREAFDAPPLTFTFEQLEALAFGIRAVEMLGDPRSGRRRARRRRRCSACCRRTTRSGLFPHNPCLRSSAQPMVPDCLGGRAFSTIGQAQGLDRLSLASGRAQPARRLAAGLGRLRAIWVMTAWCEMRQSFRDFRLDRVEDWKVMPDRFEPAPHQTYQAYLKQLS